MLWPDWNNTDAPRDGSWFIARMGLSWQTCRVRYDKDCFVPGMAFSDSFTGDFINESGERISVCQWHPDNEQRTIPPEVASLFNESALGMVECNGAEISRDHYPNLFAQIKDK